MTISENNCRLFDKLSEALITSYGLAYRTSEKRFAHKMRKREERVGGENIRGNRSVKSEIVKGKRKKVTIWFVTSQLMDVSISSL